MRIAIMGSGGIGGFVGAKLANAGHEVIFIARGDHLMTINSAGLKLVSPDGNLHIHPARACEDTAQVGIVDLILFCVKLYDTEQAAYACRPMMDRETFILTLQNGVESVPTIDAVAGQGKTVGGAIYVSAHISSPGKITHSGGSNIIRFAETNNQPGPRTEILGKIIAQAGLTGICAENLQSMLWSKFILLCANAAIGSLTDSGAVSICQDTDTKEILLAAMWEVYYVAGALGIKLPENTVDEKLEFILSAGNQQELTASQCMDLRRGNRLELEWIQGTVHRLGKKFNIPTPINSTAYVALKRFADGKPKEIA